MKCKILILVFDVVNSSTLFSKDVVFKRITEITTTHPAIQLDFDPYEYLLGRLVNDNLSKIRTSVFSKEYKASWSRLNKNELIE